jgi:hypothetical protein
MGITECYEQGETEVLVAKPSPISILMTLNWLQLTHWLVLDQTEASAVARSRLTTYVEL